MDLKAPIPAGFATGIGVAAFVQSGRGDSPGMEAGAMVRRAIRYVILGLAVAMIGSQFVPYGRSHVNPPVRAEPPWDTPRTRDLAVRACYDCHSNETTWPWYSSLAPVSWLVQHHVNEGRHVLNFSEWDRPQREARDSVKVVRRGSMPPWSYQLPHPASVLTPGERNLLVLGLEATLGGSPSPAARGGGRGPGLVLTE